MVSKLDGRPDVTRIVAATHHIHLDRAARNAGEAFAFDEPDTAPVAQKSIQINALWGAVAAVALTALYFFI